MDQSYHYGEYSVDRVVIIGGTTNAKIMLAGVFQVTIYTIKQNI